MSEIASGERVAVPPGTGKRRHIGFLDGFRALAILSIVAGHSYAFAWGEERPASSFDFLMPILSGNTALFVFISGFLFHHVFADRFDYGAFMVSKFDKLIKPYGVATAATLLVVLSVGGPTNAFLYFDGSVSMDPLSTYLVALATGVPHTALWYIPFAVLLYAASPAMMAYIQARPRERLAFLLASIALAMLVHRAAWNLNLLQNFAYFLPFYLFGLEASLRREQFSRFSASPATIAICAAGAFALAFWQMEVRGVPIPSGPPFAALGFDAMVVQKLLLIVAICGILQRIGETGHFLRTLAGDSFGIFFVHSIVLIWCVELVGMGGLSIGNKYFDLALATLLVMGASWMIVRLVKSVAPGQSRQIVGA